MKRLDDPSPITGDGDLPHVELIWQDLDTEEWIVEVRKGGEDRLMYLTPIFAAFAKSDGSLCDERYDWPPVVKDPRQAAQIVAFNHW